MSVHKSADQEAEDQAYLSMQIAQHHRLVSLGPPSRQLELQITIPLLRAELSTVYQTLRQLGLVFLDLPDKRAKEQPQYKFAVPCLVKHLQKPYSDAALSIIAHSLRVKLPEVYAAWPIILGVFRKTKAGRGFDRPGATREVELQAKLALAQLLETAYKPERLDDLIDLMRDREQGKARVFLLPILRRSKTAKAVTALKELMEDPDLAKPK